RILPSVNLKMALLAHFGTIPGGDPQRFRRGPRLPGRAGPTGRCRSGGPASLDVADGDLATGEPGVAAGTVRGPAVLAGNDRRSTAPGLVDRGRPRARPAPALEIAWE